MKFEDKYQLTSPAKNGDSTFKSISKEDRWSEIEPGIYNDGLLTICAENFTESTLRSWGWLIGEDSLIIGYLAWGDFICVSFTNKEIYLVIAQEGGKLCLGDNLESVFDYNFANDNFIQKVMLPNKFELVKKRLGELNYGECYIHEPWMMLGNEENILKYKKGDFSIYIDLLGQTWSQAI